MERTGYPDGRISIHAPREGSDSKNAQIFCSFLARVNRISSEEPMGAGEFLIKGRIRAELRAEFRCEPGGKVRALGLRTQIRRVSSGW